MSLKHGCSYEPFYRKWKDMNSRCYQKKFPGYHKYGGQGIKVCKRWRNSFENFKKDMYSTWRYGLFLLRIDPNGDFKKSNCKWVVYKRNQTNRNIKKIRNSLGEIFSSQSDASRTLGIDRTSITQCLGGWRKSAGKDKDGNPIKWFYCD